MAATVALVVGSSSTVSGSVDRAGSAAVEVGCLDLLAAGPVSPGGTGRQGERPEGMKPRGALAECVGWSGVGIRVLSAAVCAQWWSWFNDQARR